MKQIALVLAVAAALAACSKQENSATTATTTSSTPTRSSETSTAPLTPPASSSVASNSTSSGAPASPGAGTETTASTAGSAAMGAAPAGSGQEVYSKTCVACHGTGVTGAPKIGDKSDWGPRIAQGKETLYTHALNGFQGKKGVMPPKGGNTALADSDVKAAVDYMVAQAK